MVRGGNRCGRRRDMWLEERCGWKRDMWLEEEVGVVGGGKCIGVVVGGEICG